METDWSALLKAVFGSAYLMSDLVNYPDAVSISGCQQQGDSYAGRRHHPYAGCRFRDTLFTTDARVDSACAVSPVEGELACDVTMTSLSVSAAHAKDPSLAQMSKMTCWNTVAGGCSEKLFNFEGVDNEKYLPVYGRLFK